MTDYLIECHRSAREEIIFRIKHKDWYLKLQLLAQASLLAVSGGVKLGGVEATTPTPSALSLAVPLSLIFVCLYYRENKIVGHLSHYLASLVPKNIGNDTSKIVRNWDASDELRAYGKRRVSYLLVAELITFFLIPAGLFVVWMFPARPTWLRQLTIAVEVFILVALLWIVLASFNYLRGRHHCTRTLDKFKNR